MQILRRPLHSIALNYIQPTLNPGPFHTKYSNTEQKGSTAHPNFQSYRSSHRMNSNLFPTNLKTLPNMSTGTKRPLFKEMTRRKAGGAKRKVRFQRAQQPRPIQCRYDIDLLVWQQWKTKMRVQKQLHRRGTTNTNNPRSCFTRTQQDALAAWFESIDLNQ